MIAKSYIQSNLRLLESKYARARSPRECLYYSKLAVLELCGWIEESMDDIVLRCAVRNLRTPANRQLVEDSIVLRTYGFEYEKHFRQMLMRLIGLVGLERLERHVDPLQLHILKSVLGSLKAVRDQEAHTHLKGVTRRLDAPSIQRRRCTQVYDALIEIDGKLRSMRFRG